MPFHQSTRRLASKEGTCRLKELRHSFITAPVRAYKHFMDSSKLGMHALSPDWVTLRTLAPHIPLVLLVLALCTSGILLMGYGLAFLHFPHTQTETFQPRRPERLAVLGWSALVAVIYGATMWMMLILEAETGMDVSEALWQMLAGLAAIFMAIAAVILGAMFYVAFRKLAIDTYRSLYWPVLDGDKADEIPLVG